jgi:uncharacterized protein (UPF0335 family)
MAVEGSPVRVSIVPFERNHKSNADADIKSLVQRIVAVEDKIDAENKLKALIYAEAKVSGVDIGALKAAVRTVRYMPQSGAQNLAGLSTLVKQYLDHVNDAHKFSGER